MAFDTFTGYAQASFNYTVGKNGPTSSLNLPGAAVSNTITLKQSYTLGSGAGEIDEAIVEILTIAASGSATIDLTALTDVLGATADLTKLKSFLFDLLDAAQDSVNGTACTSVAIGNAVSNGNPLNMGAVTDTKILLNGDFDQYATGSAGGITVSSTVKNVLVTNNDSVHGAALLACFGGV